MSGPFLVTTRRPRDLQVAPYFRRPSIVHTVAVATLEDQAGPDGRIYTGARTATSDAIVDSGFEVAARWASARLITESGGTVTLPDGTTITVEPREIEYAVEWLLQHAAISELEHRELSTAELIDRFCREFNAAQEARR